MSYPKKWESSKYVYGVSKGEDKLDEEKSRIVGEVVRKYRKQALQIMILEIVISFALLAVPGVGLSISIWIFWLLASLIIMFIPYSRGNKELKAYKKELGINMSVKVSYVDLTLAGTIHSVKLLPFAIPVCIGIVTFILAVLLDNNIINYPAYESTGISLSFTTGTFLSVYVVLIAIAIYMDRQRNIVISMDSTVNSNYNRARKKVFADSNLCLVWINTIFLIISIGLSFVKDNETLFIIFWIAYILAIFAGSVAFMKRKYRIEEMYKDKTEDVDSKEANDDNWLWGIFYFNRDDKRTWVEKRTGYGITINMATKAGKALMWFLTAALIGCLCLCIYLGALEMTPIKVKVENGQVICHQLTDDYTIAIDKIENVELLEGIPEGKFERANGTSYDALQKGNFTVAGEKNCKLFRNPQVTNVIRIKSDNITYYISAQTDDETKDLYLQLKNNN